MNNQFGFLIPVIMNVLRWFDSLFSFFFQIYKIIDSVVYCRQLHVHFPKPLKFVFLNFCL